MKCISGAHATGHTSVVIAVYDMFVESDVLIREWKVCEMHRENWIKWASTQILFL